MVGEVTVASAEAPYLAVKLEIDPTALSDFVIAAGAPADADASDLGLAVSKVSEPMLDAATRLVGLLDDRAHQLGERAGGRGGWHHIR